MNNIEKQLEGVKEDPDMDMLPGSLWAILQKVPNWKLGIIVVLKNPVYSRQT